MPLFDFHCPFCGAAVIDVLCKRFDTAITCRECGTKMVKVASFATPRFKGPGFYATDYQGKGKE